MLREADSSQGIPRRRLEAMTESMKNAKIKLTHLGHWRKAKCV
jgi:hypothetical protein